MFRLVVPTIVGLLATVSLGASARALATPIFEAATSYGVGTYPRSVAAADLDGDGILDLAVSNSNSGTLSLFRGRGDGTFVDPITLAAGSYPEVVKILDLNHDGIEDLVVGGAGVVTFLGSGGLTYHQAGSYEGSVYFSSVAVGDLNGDGVVDIAATFPGRYE